MSQSTITAYLKSNNKEGDYMSQVYLFLAQGFEEIEALTVVDLLRRAGIDITTVSISDTHNVIGAHDIPVTADALFSNLDFSDADLLVLPGGGPGTCNLNAFEPLKNLLKDFYNKGKLANYSV